MAPKKSTSSRGTKTASGRGGHRTGGETRRDTGAARTLEAVRIRGARQNNLKNLDIDIPLNRLTVITGVSGSGKSSLAFDTLYSEGQRLYVETFSAYTRQFLDRMDKPAVDSVEGIPPAIAIDQTNPVRTSRSTVGTMTELNDHLKLLFARAATLHCESCGRPVQSDTPESVADEIEAMVRRGAPGATASPTSRTDGSPARVVITFPVSVPAKLDQEAVEDLVQRQGYRGIHARDGEIVHITQDRVRLPGAERARLVEDLEQAMEHGQGKVSVWVLGDDGDSAAGAGSRAGAGKRTASDGSAASRGVEHRFSADLHCARCDIHYRDPVPNLFSFNSPLGACETCRGFGRVIGIDYGLVVPDESLTLHEGAVKPWQSKSYAECQRDLLRFARRRGIRLDVPWRDLTDEERAWVIQGEGDWDEGRWYGTSRFFDWLEGRAYKMHVRVLLSRYRSYNTCPTCHGARLKPEALLWRIGGKSVHEVMLMPISDLVELFTDLPLPAPADEAAQTVLEEIRRRLTYLVDVGLGYLNLDRQSRTLSGGEVQRVNLTTALGTSLVNALFVLDEPSIGLHARDVDRLVGVLHKLRDSGNTIVIVEHDPALIRAGDHLIDLGPAAGSRGGEIVYRGTAAGILAEPQSLTGQYLNGTLQVDTWLPEGATAAGNRRRPRPGVGDEPSDGDGASGGGGNSQGGSPALRLLGAREHNLKSIDLEIPLGRIVAITGVSGSGKSTLVEDVLHRAALRHLGRATEQPGGHDALELPDAVEDVVLVDQSSIGKSARSNPASYVGAFDAIRSVFATLPAAKERGYSAGTFSFNSKKGQCATCKGSGFEHIEMQFLSDVYLRCPECGGRRFKREVLEVRNEAGLTIADVLDLTVDEAIELFADHTKVVRALQPLAEVGLGYVKLGQPVPTLSGGESQRLKLASHLGGAARKRAHTLFLFDEPTTGLHFADISRLLDAFRALKTRGNTVVVIEHNLDIVRAADLVVDLGPEGGNDGGEIVFSGTPAELMESATHTGRQLAAYVRNLAARPGVEAAGPGVAMGGPGVAAEAVPEYGVRVDEIEVRGAREHNLTDIDLEIPHDRFTVLTGVSGSGKSTVAFDIIFAEGQRRYLESLNAYARQFVQPAARAEMDGAVGIPPTVAIEQRTSRGGQKSTVATVTEISQFLRLLYSKLGTQYCPDCDIPIQSQSEEVIADSILNRFHGQEIRILSPLVIGRKGYYTDLAKWAAKKGFPELRVDGVMTPTDAWPRLERYQEHDIELPFGPVEVGSGRRGKAGATGSATREPDLRTILREALDHGEGVVYVLTSDSARHTFSTHYACPRCHRSFDEPEPRLFSFNSRQGQCPTCLGTGVVLEAEERSALSEDAGWDRATSETLPCPDCGGTRLKPEARAVRFRDRSIPEMNAMSISAALEAVEQLELTDREEQVAGDLLREMSDRLRFLEEVGLGYLSLDRAAPTLSGGEAQRIRLAAQLGSNLRGVCYVLDEPTIGLHPRDNRMLLDVLRRLTDKGNTVLVVEHDEETIRAADYVVDLGPGGGVRGGSVVARGSLDEILKNTSSITGQWLARSRQASPEPATSRDRGDSAVSQQWLTVHGASMHNLKGLNVRVPVGKLVTISGVSGSGKSTLGRDVLFTSLHSGEPAGCDDISGHESIQRVLEVDQTPIGKTPRSTPATYIGVWDNIRALFASLPDARMRGYTASRFSFNTVGGRCEVCGGQGVQRIEMSFLPDVQVRCDACNGKRFNEETLAVRFRGKSIADVLAMDVEEAAAFFSSQPKIRNALELLVEVGLGYLTLGQASPTLSGGEAQRIKLVSELARSSATTEKLSAASRAARKAQSQRAKSGSAPMAGGALPGALYLLDEPTVGLHMADVDQLIRVLRRLVETGATVVVIEHNLEVIAASDWVIDLGPEGGDEGGQVVAEGSPSDIAASEASYTGAFLDSIFR